MRARTPQTLLLVAGLVLTALVGCSSDSDGADAPTTTVPLGGSLALRPADVADADRCPGVQKR